MIHLKLKCKKLPYPVYSGGLSKSDISALRKFVRRAIKELPVKSHYYVWSTGTSGASISLMVQTLCPEESSKLKFVSVRKKQDDSHDWCWEDEVKSANDKINAYHIFIDDCIASGETFKRVISRRNPQTFDEVWLFNEADEDVEEFLEQRKITKCISCKKQ